MPEVETKSSVKKNDTPTICEKAGTSKEHNYCAESVSKKRKKNELELYEETLNVLSSIDNRLGLIGESLQDIKNVLAINR